MYTLFATLLRNERGQGEDESEERRVQAPKSTRYASIPDPSCLFGILRTAACKVTFTPHG